MFYYNLQGCICRKNGVKIPIFREVADIADTLAESFSEISSNKHYSSKFQSYKAHAERQTLKFKSHNLEHTTLLSL